MNFVKKRIYFYTLSLLVIIPGIIALCIFGLRLGLDFSGGAMIELTWQDENKAEEVVKEIKNMGRKEIVVQSAGEKAVIVKIASKNQEEAKNLAEEIKKNLTNKVAGVTEKNFALVGPTVSKNLQSKSIKAVIVASLGIIFYIAFAFRKVEKPASPWRFGVAAIIALLHDLLVVLGIFAILGHFFNWAELDAMFITALLTILGFSVHDTIVVFDRIRENLRLYPQKLFEEVVNSSLLQTLSRSINTSLVVIITLLTLFILGGETIKGFILALLIGIVSGTYSSIFNASLLIVSWQKFIEKRSLNKSVHSKPA